MLDVVANAKIMTAYMKIHHDDDHAVERIVLQKYLRHRSPYEMPSNLYLQAHIKDHIRPFHLESHAYD